MGMDKQTELEVGVTDNYIKVSADTDTYKCHKCTKRGWCKDRRPDKAYASNWEGRKECENYEIDPRWWQ